MGGASAAATTRDEAGAAASRCRPNDKLATITTLAASERPTATVVRRERFRGRPTADSSVFNRPGLSPGSSWALANRRNPDDTAR
jgi:hypothetical protein